jgi:hypothetical protein
VDFFLGSIPQLRNFFGLPDQTDPMKVEVAILKTLSLYCSMERIYIADNLATFRHEAQAVFLCTHSSFHKLDAMFKVKVLLVSIRKDMNFFKFMLINRFKILFA